MHDLGSANTKDYSFALNRTIVDVFTESELFDTSYWWEPGIIEIDMPLFLHLDDGTVLHLFGNNLSVACEDSWEKQSGDIRAYPGNATPEFKLLIGKQIMAVHEIYDPICEAEDLDEPHEMVCLDVVLDAPLLMECFYGCLYEFTLIKIWDRIA